jgi:hypothetical protein
LCAGASVRNRQLHASDPLETVNLYYPVISGGTIFNISRPIGSDAVAAGEGTFSRCRNRSRSTSLDLPFLLFFGLSIQTSLPLTLKVALGSMRREAQVY